MLIIAALCFWKTIYIREWFSGQTCILNKEVSIDKTAGWQGCKLCWWTAVIQLKDKLIWNNFSNHYCGSHLQPPEVQYILRFAVRFFISLLLSLLFGELFISCWLHILSIETPHFSWWKLGLYMALVCKSITNHKDKWPVVWADILLSNGTLLFGI